MASDMHVERRRARTQHMIVHGGYLQPAFNQLEHDRIDLGLQQYEISHRHRTTMGRLERDPAAQRERGLDGDAVKRDREIGARETISVDVTRDDGRLSADGLVDLLPIDLLRSRGGIDERRHDRNHKHECWTHGHSPSSD
jgi:hypothetical protein